jgi:hypothetical protein
MSTETEVTRVDVVTSIERRVGELDEYRNVLTPDDACQLLDAIASVKQRVEQAEESLKAFLLTWLPENGNDLRIGTKHWWVGPKKRPPKCKNVTRALEAIMEKTGGDWEATGNTLGSNAIKYGEARKILGNTFLDHFEIIEKDELLSEGENPNVLQCQDDRFIK